MSVGKAVSFTEGAEVACFAGKALGNPDGIRVGCVEGIDVG